VSISAQPPDAPRAPEPLGSSSTRAALADVLAVLTTESDATWWRGIVSRYAAAFDGAVVLGVAGGGVAYDVGRLRCADPAEALAALVEAEAVPEHWIDAARAPRWWCRCNGAGDGIERDGVTVVCRHRSDRRGCGGGHWPAPPSHAALVAVASLGAASLARAEAIVAETWPGRALVWRVMTAEALTDHQKRAAQMTARGADMVVRAAAMLAAFPENDDGWRIYYGALGVDTRPLEALAALGLQLVALDAGRVVLAVEAPCRA
jgi:hypothetical protein